MCEAGFPAKLVLEECCETFMGFGSFMVMTLMPTACSIQAMDVDNAYGSRVLLSCADLSIAGGEFLMLAIMLSAQMEFKHPLTKTSVKAGLSEVPFCLRKLP